MMAGMRQAEAPFRQSLADAQSAGMSLSMDNIRLTAGVNPGPASL
jgi:hypothetical protein